MGTKHRKHSEIKTVSVSLLLPLLKRIDALVIEGHLMSRSEGIQAALLEYLPKIETIRPVPPYPNLWTLHTEMVERKRLVNPNHRKTSGKSMSHLKLGNIWHPEVDPLGGD